MYRKRACLRSQYDLSFFAATFFSRDVTREEKSSAISFALSAGGSETVACKGGRREETREE